MGQAASTQTRQAEILREKRTKVQKSLTRLNIMLDQCDDETAEGLEELRDATREQLDELEQRLEQIRQT